MPSNNEGRSAMSAVTELPTTPDRQPPPDSAVRLSDWNSPRRCKETLLPQFVQLALEGHSAEAIARQFDMPGRTVRYWLHESRQEWLAASAGGAAEMLAVTMARLTAIYREAMEEWRDSRRDVETRLVEDTQMADDSHPAKQKRSLRTQPPRRNAAMLTRATAAAKAMFDLKLRTVAALSKEKDAGPSGKPPIPVETLTPKDIPPRPAASSAVEMPIPLENLSQKDIAGMSEEELRPLVARCKAEMLLSGLPVPVEPPRLTEEELAGMSADELRAEIALTRAEFAVDERSLPWGTLTAEDLETVTDAELRAVLAKGLAERRAAGQPLPSTALTVEDLSYLTEEHLLDIAVTCLDPDADDDDFPPDDADSPAAAGAPPPDAVSQVEEEGVLPEPEDSTPDSRRPSVLDANNTQRSATPVSCENAARPLEDVGIPCDVESGRPTCTRIDFRQVPAIGPP
jgi:hypothetical protein